MKLIYIFFHGKTIIEKKDICVCGDIMTIRERISAFVKRKRDPNRLSARRIPPKEALEIPDSFPKEWLPEKIIPQDKIPPGSGDAYVHSPLIDIYTKRWGVSPIADLPVYRDMERNQPWIRTGLWKTTHLALEKGGEWTCDDPETDEGKRLLEDTNAIFRPVYSQWMNIVRPCMVYNGLAYGFAPVEKIYADTLKNGYEPNYVKYGDKKKLTFQTGALIKEHYQTKVDMKKQFAEVDGVYDVEPGNLINLKACDPYYFRVLRDSLGNVYGYLQIINSPYKAFTTDKIMFFRYNPTTVPSESAYGTSALMALVRTTELLEACENNIHIALHQIVKQPAIFSPPQSADLMPLSDPDWARISADEEERVAGDSIMSRGAKVDLMPIDGAALQGALAWRNTLREDLMVGMDVPWVIFGMPMSSNRSQSEVNLDDFVVKLHGIQQLVGRSELEDIVIPGLLRKGWKKDDISEMNLRYDWNGVAIQDEASQEARSLNKFKDGAITRNECRDELNLLPVDDKKGDVFYDELGMGEGGEDVNPFKSETLNAHQCSAQSDAVPHFPSLIHEIVCPKCNKRDKTEDLSKVILCASCGSEMKVMKEPPLEWSPDENFFNEQLKADWGTDIKNGLSAAKIPDSEIDKWVTINGVKVPIGKDGKPHKDFDMGKVGDRGKENGDGKSELGKKAAESTDFKSFAKENVNELKEMGIKNFRDANDFFITSKIDNMERKEISREKAVSIIKGNIKDSIMNGWFRKEDKGFKGKLVEQIMKDKETANAGLNIMHENYKNTFGSDISFNDFMDKEITLYRGGDILDEPFTSFSMNEDIAKKFDKGEIMKIKIKPKDTLGSYQTTTETEVLIPKQMYDKMKAHWETDIKNGLSAAKIPDSEIDKWVTINGVKVPIGKDGKPHKDFDMGKVGDRGKEGVTDTKTGVDPSSFKLEDYKGGKLGWKTEFDWNKEGKSGNIIKKFFNGGDQSIISISEDKNSKLLKVDLLEANPDGTKGKGARAMYFAVKESMKKGYDGELMLTSSTKSIGFYEHIGMMRIGRSQQMIMTDSAAKRFIGKFERKYGKP